MNKHKNEIEDIINNLKVSKAIFTDTYWDLIKQCSEQDPQPENVENIKTKILEMMNDNNPTIAEGVLGISYALIIALKHMDQAGVIYIK